MSRKPKKGYFVRGQFVAEGSELDLQLKAELKHFQENSKTELKRESTELQKLGESLMALRGELFERLQLPDKLVEAMDEARRITNFEGRRRQMQYVGKLMRGLDEEQLAAAREALEQQRKGSAKESLALHQAEQWRDDLIERDEALQQWLDAHPDTDSQQLRALIRQARRDRQPSADEISRGEVPRHGRAYREIFQMVKEQLQHEPE
ncbi:MAG TPA: ribosome biogenesis factor YjgA [Ramlibacter sp.]|jgi:ribosome-associated protein|uniref:ribosome biogenesis factor YjgA n=1 Tax=Ramlibacter sp. TaxID=1917967 RepID=UPI002D3DC49B|nr:ribosome biogenesis factor YjgA [Ramlibacter sp.]HZY19602.1 ribosome biogenesis factor YjgA [Ramlibacter sp.]